MSEAQLKSAEFYSYTEIIADLERLHRGLYYSVERRQELLEDLEMLRDCTEWVALRKRIVGDIARFDTKHRARAGVQACATIGAAAEFGP